MICGYYLDVRVLFLKYPENLVSKSLPYFVYAGKIQFYSLKTFEPCQQSFCLRA